MFKPQRKCLILYGVVAVVFLNYFICILYSDVYIRFSGSRFELSTEDIKRCTSQLKSKQHPDFKTLNKFNASFIHFPKCDVFAKGQSKNLIITVLVRSSNKHFQRRVAIRKTWGYRQIFTPKENISLNTIFVVGSSRSHIDQMFLDGESENFKDLLQIAIEDNHFNKTMIAFKYAVEICKNTHFFMIVDDDYFVSLRNVARFVTNPLEYPSYFKHIEIAKKLSEIMLYAGSVVNHNVEGGAALYSTKALQEIYYTSLYVKPRNNINKFIGEAAGIAGIDPVNVLAFKMCTSRNRSLSFYNDLISVNGFEDGEDMTKLWTDFGFKLAKFKF